MEGESDIICRTFSDNFLHYIRNDGSYTVLNIKDGSSEVIFNVYKLENSIDKTHININKNNKINKIIVRECHSLLIREDQDILILYDKGMLLITYPHDSYYTINFPLEKNTIDAIYYSDNIILFHYEGDNCIYKLSSWSSSWISILLCGFEKLLPEFKEMPTSMNISNEEHNYIELST